MSSACLGRGAYHLALACSVAAVAAACSQTTGSSGSSDTFDTKYGVSSSPRSAAVSGPSHNGGGSYKLGVPYKIAERWYVPREEPGYDRQGIGSWYGDDFHGRKTANGEIFDMNALTAAHPTLPLPSYAYVTNLATGRTILVRINDRGPYAQDRVIDLSHASARALGYEHQGTSRVRVRYAGRAPLNGDDRREHQYLAEQPWFRGGALGIASAPPANAPRSLAEPFQAGTAGRWSPAGYRAAFAGRPQASAAPPFAVAPLATSHPPLTHAGYTSRTALGRLQPASGTTRTYVQVGLYRERSNAERLQRDLANIGSIEIAALADNGGSVYRVRIGPMSAQEAHTAMAQVQARGVAGSTITSE